MASINQPVQPIRTHEGGIACRTGAYQQLRRSVLACMLWEDSFYEDGQSIAQRIQGLVKQCKPYEVSELAIEARNQFKLRHIPLLLARELARAGNTGSMVSHTLFNVIQRADELAEFLAIYWKDGKQPLSGQVKKGLAKAFTKFDAYQLAKYNRDNAIKLRDVLFLCHAKPKDDAQAAMWKQLVDGTLPVPDTWEVALSGGADKKVTFERLLTEKKLGYLALLRNLRNMLGSGVSLQLMYDALINGAEHSKALPFRFVAAARACPQLEPTLDLAMTRAISGMEGALPGRTALLVDVSASMNDPLSSKSDLKRGDAAGALAALLRAVCEDVHVYKFHDSLESVPPRAGMALVDLVSPMRKGTRLGASLRQLERVGRQYDRVIVITDEQTRDSIPAPIGRGYILNVSTEKNGIGYGQWVKIDGFSEAVVQYIIEAEKDAR